MDAGLTGAITAVQLGDAGRQQQWFDLICRAYDQALAAGETDWSRFGELVAELADAEGVGRETAEQFVEYLGATDPQPLETVGRMRELGDELPAYYQQMLGGEPEQQEAGGTSEAEWYAFLAENGPRWNGDEAAWDQFKQWFLYEADQRNLAIPANEFIGYAESQSDKVAVFAQYGVAVPVAAGGDSSAAAAAPDVGAFPDVQEGDSGEWVDYLDQMLRSKGF